MLIKVDNQPIDSRFGEAVWLTDFITPDNPEVVLKYRELTKGLYRTEDIVAALWHYVAIFPYRPTIAARLKAGGKSFYQDDTWFYPAETIKIETSNCANRAFLLASLMKNHLSNPGDVYVVVGNISLDGIGAHAWVQVNIGGRPYILETTQPNLPHVLIPVSSSGVYLPAVYFDENSVYTVNKVVDVAEELNARFGLCAVHFLHNYLCDKCLSL